MNKTVSYTTIFLLAFFVLSCSGSPRNNLELLNGYWEIAEIENTHGSKKEYGLSKNIDFFVLTNEKKGVRKKVQPDIQGNFTTTNAGQNIDVLIKGTNVFLKYSTPFDSWQEEVLSLTKDKLVLQNEDEYIYTYRRYEPLIIE